LALLKGGATAVGRLVRLVRNEIAVLAGPDETAY
jgi:hypothetical protein